MKHLALILLALCPLLSAFAADKPAHLFILTGQSNMAGMDPKLGFEPEAKKLFPGADVAHIKVAVGGMPIRYWVDEWNDIAAKHGVDVAKAREADKRKGTIFYPRILEQFAELLKQHPNAASVTFCWMQGENDSRTGLQAPYADALKQLIANLRRDLKRPEMNVVIGRLSDHDELNPSAWKVVRESQVAVALADPHGAWVDCDDLNDKEVKGVMTNDLHYTKPGYELLGRRFVRQAKALIEGGKPAENGRPE
ncbi:MAG TPA: acetyl xylan esterase [Verrucomicrobiales bacterium]|nr:acetyl xylan esterase [Verrucomicrobiales bacterium]HRJ08701.1 sialate O-acetylesterase [Prosthecobacter sp.]HRK14026.1 sialate O-acetylesterase [Prosthecobacter sp.]